MPSVRLWESQIKRLKKNAGHGGTVITLAVRRWQNGTLVIDFNKEEEKRQEILQVYPITKKIEGLSSKKIRMILDAHRANPAIRYDDEIDELGKTIDFLTNAHVKKVNRQNQKSLKICKSFMEGF